MTIYVAILYEHFRVRYNMLENHVIAASSNYATLGSINKKDQCHISISGYTPDVDKFALYGSCPV